MRRRGFVLLAAMMLCVVLVVVGALLVQQQRMLANRSLRFERQYATQDQAYSDFQHALALNQLGELQIPSQGYTQPVASKDLSAQAGDLRQTFRGLASTSFPIGLMAMGGDLNVRSVRSVHDYDNDPQDSRLMGMMARVAASGSVQVNGHLNGHAYAQGGSAQTTDGSGILHSHWASPLELPVDFSDALAQLRGALQATPGSLKVPATIANSLRIPPDECQNVDSGLSIAQDLLIGDNAVLRVAGDLKVSGSVYIGQQSSLIVEGSTTISGLNLSYSWHKQAMNLATICSCVYSRGPLQILGNAMGYAEIIDWVPGDPALPEYLGSCQAEIPDTTDVPGVLLVSDSNLTVQGGHKIAGLLYASGIQLKNVDQLLGTAWSTQSIQAGDTNYRCFPFYTHAFIHTSASNVTLNAAQSHATAWGQLP